MKKALFSQFGCTLGLTLQCKAQNFKFCIKITITAFKYPPSSLNPPI